MVFFFNDTATTEIYTLSLHDALPISDEQGLRLLRQPRRAGPVGHRCLSRGQPDALRRGTRMVQPRRRAAVRRDRKSTRLNSSHANISYAVFCLKKQKQQTSQ